MEIANKVGAAEITSRVVEDLKDENEQFRKMVMDCIEKVSERERREGRRKGWRGAEGRKDEYGGEG